MRIEGLRNLIHFVKYMRNKPQNEFIKKNEIMKDLNIITAKTIYRIYNKLKEFGFEFESKDGHKGGIKMIENNRLTLEELQEIEFTLRHESELKDIERTIEKIKIMNDKVF